MKRNKTDEDAVDMAKLRMIGFALFWTFMAVQFGVSHSARKDLILIHEDFGQNVCIKIKESAPVQVCNC